VILILQKESKIEAYEFLRNANLKARKTAISTILKGEQLITFKIWK
jgi:hypothetical protein